MMKVQYIIRLLTAFAMFYGSQAFAWEQDVPPMKVGTYEQEIGTIYTQSDGLPSNDILSIAVTPDGIVYAGTANGLAAFREGVWSAVNDTPAKPVLALEARRRIVLALYDAEMILIRDGAVRKIADYPPCTINDIAVYNRVVYMAANNGLYRVEEGQIELVQEVSALNGIAKPVYAVAVNQDGNLCVAAENGLLVKKETGPWFPIYPHDQTGRSWSPRNVHGTAYDDNGRLWFASSQGVGCLNETWTLYDGPDGLPFNDFTCVCPGGEGVVWFGTTIGAIRFDGQTWAYRQGRCWLPNDTVNDIAVTPEGNAWFATPGGVGLIERRPMTLAEKAAFYEDEAEKYIKRTEYGYLSEVNLKKPGDRSEIIYSDSDNDGLWTSMYGAGECFAYGATHDPKAKQRAKQAFEALRFLSAAPVEGEVEQQPGYVARTVLPTTEPDPNQREGHSIEHQKRNRETNDGRWKVYTPRWPLTKDGKYWYKTDTSSDELDGHFFFYPLYYDLVADTPEEKERVREVVANIADHLIRNDFCLVDHDGTPARWGVFGPSELNHNYDWMAERGLNSLSILAYLTVAEHVIGNGKYQEQIDNLIEKHGYGMNAMITKLQRGPGSGNQSDDEMAFMSYYNLIKYTRNEQFRKQVIYSFYNAWIVEYPEMNPFFNFAFAACAQGETYSDIWGTHDMSPWEGWLEDSIETLKGFPLDRVDWGHRNSHRIDLIRLGRHTGPDPTSSIGHPRGYRTNGKVIPVQERHFNHWNTDPWTLDIGGNGHTLASGTVFLLPYYMGLYHGYIE